MSNLKVIQLLPELNIGGVERGVCDLSKELVKRNISSEQAVDELIQLIKENDDWIDP